MSCVYCEAQTSLASVIALETGSFSPNYWFQGTIYAIFQCHVLTRLERDQLQVSRSETGKKENCSMFLKEIMICIQIKFARV